MVQESCFELCKGYAFAGLPGEECFCFDVWMDWAGAGERDTADGTCNIRCPRDKSQMRGRDTKNALIGKRQEALISVGNEVSRSSSGQTENVLDKRKEPPAFLSIYQNIDTLPDGDTTMCSLYRVSESALNATMDGGSLMAKENLTQVASNSVGKIRDLSWGMGCAGKGLRVVDWDLWGERGDVVSCQFYWFGELVLLRFWVVGLFS